MHRKFNLIDFISRKNQMIVLMIIGLIMGTVFTFGMSYWNEKVDRCECTQYNSTYDSHKLIRERVDVKEIIINFSNEEVATIDSVSISDELINEIEKFDYNSKIFALCHPNSNTIMELVVNGKVLLDFDSTMNKLVIERNGFIFLGCIMYLFAFISIVNLAEMRKKK